MKELLLTKGFAFFLYIFRENVLAFYQWSLKTFRYNEINIFNFDDLGDRINIPKIIESFEFIAC